MTNVLFSFFLRGGREEEEVIFHAWCSFLFPIGASVSNLRPFPVLVSSPLTGRCSANSSQRRWPTECSGCVTHIILTYVYVYDVLKIISAICSGKSPWFNVGLVHFPRAKHYMFWCGCNTNNNTNQPNNKTKKPRHGDFRRS